MKKDLLKLLDLTPEDITLILNTVTRFLSRPTSIRKVIFNVFQDADAALYRALLGEP